MKFQSIVKNEMQKKGYLVINIIRLSDNGYPDLLCIKKGEKDIWIECKEGKDTLKPLQKFRIDELIKLDKIAYCLHKQNGKIYPL